MVWGSSSLRSCDQLIERIERNDPTLVELVVLPLKTFGSNQLERIAQCIQDGRNNNLTSLHASGHAIDDCDVLEHFGVALSSRGTSNKLVDIAIGDVELADDGIVAFCRGLKKKPTKGSEEDTNQFERPTIHIHKLDLSYKGISKRGLLSLLDTLGNQTSLQSIDISRNDFRNVNVSSWVTEQSNEHDSMICPVFPKVTYLDLSSCKLDSDSLLGWLVALDGNSRNNMILKLNGNCIGGNRQIDSKSFGYFDLVQTRTSQYVKELYLSDCDLDDNDLNDISDYWFQISPLAEHLAPQNRGQSKTQVLDLTQNKFTADGLMYFADTLQNQGAKSPGSISQTTHHVGLLHSLKSLTLSGNQFNDESSLKFATALSQCKGQGILQNLQELDLSKSNCGVNAAIVLISKCELTNLNLFGNGIGSDGFVTLSMSNVLTGGHSSLVTLDLGGNNASESSVVALLQPLFQSSQPAKGKPNQLRLLVVGGNQAGPTVEATVSHINSIHPDLDIAWDKPKRNT